MAAVALITQGGDLRDLSEDQEENHAGSLVSLDQGAGSAFGVTLSISRCPSGHTMTLFGWIVKRHAELYAQEYRWLEPFEGVCAQIVADFVNKFDERRERCWIAEIDGENAGTVMVVNDGDSVARLRLLLVEPSARGLGIGERLTDEAIRFARGADYRKMTLWTHSVLTAARHIYQKAGFKLTHIEPHQSWGQPVVSEHYDFEL